MRSCSQYPKCFQHRLRSCLASGLGFASGQGGCEWWLSHITTALWSARILQCVYDLLSWQVKGNHWCHDWMAIMKMHVLCVNYSQYQHLQFSIGNCKGAHWDPLVLYIFIPGVARYIASQLYPKPQVLHITYCTWEYNNIVFACVRVLSTPHSPFTCFGILLTLVPCWVCQHQ